MDACHLDLRYQRRTFPPHGTRTQSSDHSRITATRHRLRVTKRRRKRLRNYPDPAVQGRRSTFRIQCSRPRRQRWPTKLPRTIHSRTNSRKICIPGYRNLCRPKRYLMVSTIKDSSSWHHMESDKEFQAPRNKSSRNRKRWGSQLCNCQAFRGLAIG